MDRSGRPLFSVGIIILFGVLGYISVSANGATVFVWLQALSGLAALFTWGSICVAHIRFRAAWKHNGHTLDEIPFQAALGVYGSWLGLFLCVIVLMAQFYVAVEPLSAEAFFESFLAAPVLIVFWIGGYVWKREGWKRVSEIDVDTGRREHDWEEIRAYREHLAAQPAWKRLYHAVF